ncbi:MAG: hypothetical protein ACI4N3_02300 [Alphaproteobacteria bacterium]
MNNITENKIRDIVREEITRVLGLEKKEKFIKDWVEEQKEEYKVYVRMNTIIGTDDFEEEIPAPADMLSFEQYLKREAKDDGISYEDVKNYLTKQR